MDVISLGKASKALREIKALDEQVVAPLAESRFPSVDARLDWLEKQTTDIEAINAKDFDLTQGTMDKVELVNGKIQLKELGILSEGLGNNLIPVMTSNTTPSGRASASNEFGSQPAALAFDGQITDPTRAWATNPGFVTGWLAYEFPESIVVSAYSLVPQTSLVTRTPKDFTFEGSHDGVTWDVLDTRVGETGWINSEKRVYSFSNDVAYKHYRINISANNGDSYLAIGEMEMMQNLVVRKYTTEGTYETPVIDLGEGYNQTVEAVIDRLIFASTVAIPTGSTGTPFSNYLYNASYSDADAFNGILTGDGDAWLSATTPPYELGYEFPTKQTVGMYTIYPRSYGSDYPVDWTFEAWDEENQSWVVLDTQVGVTGWKAGVGKDFVIKGIIFSSTKYRLNMTKSQSGARVAITELMFYEAESSVVIEISASNNGVTFSDYQPVETGDVPQGRYVKMRATFQGIPESDSTNTYEFDQSEQNKMEPNEFVLEDGNLQLRKDYTYLFEDVTTLGSGKIVKTTIPKSLFKQMNSLGVR